MMLGTEHFFTELDHSAKLRCSLRILALDLKRFCQIVARDQRVRILGTEHFLTELEHRAKLRFSLGILALVNKRVCQIVARL